MQIHQLKPKHPKRAKRRVGRGGKRGTYSGKGLKGQRSRAGRNFEPLIRLVIKRYPKLRGYRFHVRESNVAVINTGDLEKKFNASDVINPDVLIEKRLIRRIKGQNPVVKILGRGKITKKFVFENCQFSKNAKILVEKTGSQIK